MLYICYICCIGSLLGYTKYHQNSNLTIDAKAQGMPLPGRVTDHCDKVMVLPSDITRTHFFNQV